MLFRWMFSKKNKRLEEDKQNEELSKDNKGKDENGVSESKDVSKGKSFGGDDHSYKNLMGYFADYSYYEKALVDKGHDKNNKF